MLLIPTVLVTASSQGSRLEISRVELLALYPGAAQIEGDLAFNALLSPSVAKIGDVISLDLSLLNNSADPISPVVRIILPSSLKIDVSSLPAGTALNLQNQEVVWSPVLNGQGGAAEGLFYFAVESVDLEEPEQSISFEIAHKGKSQLAEVTFWAGELPSGSFTINPDRASVGQPVQLSANYSGNGPVNQSWYLSDGRQILAENPTVVFPEVGTFPIILYLTNPAGTTAIEQFISVVPEPAAFINLSNSAPAVNEYVQFQSTGGGQQPLNHYWDFGDGAFSTDPNPIHQYPVPGSYTVVYTVENAFGSSQNFIELNVGTPPTADAVLPSTGQVGSPLSGQAYTDDTVQTIRWDMGDGTILEGINISHTYQSAGTYTIQMKAIGLYGAATISYNVEIIAGQTDIYLPIILQEMLSDLSAVEAEADLAADSGVGEENILVSTLADANVEAEIILVDNPEIAGADLAAQLYWYINEARRQAELNPVNLIPSLSVAAKQHTNDMAAFKYTGHTGSDGTHPYERLARVGYREGGYAGETTAWGFRTPREAVDFWLNSPPHRAILLNPLANQVGVAQTTNYNAPNVWYWTAEFASTYGSIESQLLEAGIRTNGYIPIEPIAEDTIIFYWYWPLPLEPNQTFSLYSIHNGIQKKVGSIREPIDQEQKPFDYGYPVLGLDLASSTGDTEWFVRLESLSGQQATQSQVELITIYGDWPTPTAIPTLIPTATPVVTVPIVVPVTSTPVPTPTPLGQTGNTATLTPSRPSVTSEPVPVVPTSTPTPLSQQPAPTSTPLSPADTATPLPTVPTSTETNEPVLPTATLESSPENNGENTLPAPTSTSSKFPATSTPVP